MRFWPERGDSWVLLLLFLGGLLLLTRLDNGRLWQDEAETAVLAKNTLRFGYPRAFDGVNRLNPAVPLAAGEAWTYHPWLPMYLLALFFQLFGAGTLTARLPFALMGLGSLLLAYRLLLKWSGDRDLARLFSLLFLLCVPFLLHMRQCRYYAPSLLLSLWASWAYWRWLQARPRSEWNLGLALVLLFHANHGAFVPMAGACLAHALWSGALRSRMRSALAIALPVALLTLPFALFLQSGQHHVEPSWREIRHHTEFYFRQINHYLLPVTFWLPLLLLWPGFRRAAWGRGAPALPPDLRRWILSVLGIGLLFLILGPAQRHFRYLIHLMPWLLLVQAILLLRLIRLRRWIGIPVALLLTLTDVHYALPGSKPVRSLPAEFIGELTHTYRGPIDGIVELLLREGKPGQTVKIPTEDHPILFYTSLKVEPLARLEDFQRETYPDWIVILRHWVPDAFFESDYYRRIEARYRRIVLDAPDLPWQNRPDPGYHRFRTDSSASPVVVFSKR